MPDTASRPRRRAKATAMPPTPAAEGQGTTPRLPPGAFASPRQTLPINANVLGTLPWAFLPRRQYQDMDLTTITPGAFSPQQIMDLLADAWPDLALALWNFLRLAAAGYSYDVRTPDNTDADPAGKAALDALLTRVNRNWGGFDALIVQWVMSVALEGACAGETIPTPDFEDVDDITTVQPWTVYFQRDVQQNYVAYQWQPMLTLASGTFLQAWESAKTPNTSSLAGEQDPLAHGGFRRLNETTFAYVPLDAAVDDPYGRMPFASIMQLVVFDAQLLKDLRQWSHVNAFGRMDVTVLAAEVEKVMPAADRANDAKRVAFLKQYVTDLTSLLNTPNPDDTFVHFDNVKWGAVNSAGQTFQIDNLIRIVERRIFRALKQLPILMGSNEGTTETWGTLQMEVYALGIASMQRVVATLIERLLTVALRILGFTSVVHFTFQRLRASDRIKTATADGMLIKNAAAKRDQGWITQDEAAIEVTGSQAVAPGPNPDPLVAVDQPNAAPGGKAATVPAPPAKAPAPTATKARAPHPDLVPPQFGPSQPLRPSIAPQSPAPAAPRASGSHHTPAFDTHARSLARAVRAVIKGQRVKRATVVKLVKQYARTAPASRRGRYQRAPQWTPAERAALLAALMQSLMDDLPDDDADLWDTLTDARQATWDSAGQAALKLIGLEAVFKLTNANLLNGIRTRSAQSAAQIQGTTRTRVAGAIADGIIAGDSAGDVYAAASDTLADQADRADVIGQTETTSAWSDASIQTWQQNGVPMKVWRTGDDPDPGAGAKGATPCRDNAYAGAIPIGDTFPSGDDAPPAHASCVCSIEPSGDPSDAAQADPWAGGD